MATSASSMASMYLPRVAMDVFAHSTWAALARSTAAPTAWSEATGRSA
jgi:hypothetical protein